MKDLLNHSEEYFVSKCVGIASKLSFQVVRTHHHILLLLQCGVMEYIDHIDSIIFAEITPTSDPEHCELLQMFIHLLSPYCGGRTQNRICTFNYDSMEVEQHTHIEHTRNRVIYHLISQEDLKVIP